MKLSTLFNQDDLNEYLWKGSVTTTYVNEW